MTNQLTPPDCRLTDFPYMPVDIRRLLNSDTWLLANDSERSAAMCLWLESWHQVPAASIPNNDKVLAALSKAANKWSKVKDQALRGWVDGGDGRLYHPVVAEKALESFIEKLLSGLSGTKGNEKRWGVKIDTSDLISQLSDAVSRLKALSPNSKYLTNRVLKYIDHRNRPPIATPLQSESHSVAIDNDNILSTETTSLPRVVRATDESPPDFDEPTPIPDDFKPDRQAQSSAMSMKLDIEFERERFMAHYQARPNEKRNGMQAWQAQFRKWLCDQKQYTADREKVTAARVSAADKKKFNPLDYLEEQHRGYPDRTDSEPIDITPQCMA